MWVCGICGKNFLLESVCPSCKTDYIEALSSDMLDNRIDLYEKKLGIDRNEIKEKCGQYGIKMVMEIEKRLK
jgi:hypothetical protein